MKQTVAFTTLMIPHALSLEFFRERKTTKSSKKQPQLQNIIKVEISV
jgi:hypothetical protein